MASAPAPGIRAEAVEQMERPAMMTIPNVPILETGTYHLSSGLTTFTEEDLADAVLAQDDPAVLPPRLKLGHVDPRFDGEPALGTAQNLRLSANGQTIIADFVGVPSWLAEIMPSAYPNRSIEGDFNVDLGPEGLIGAETSTGRTYRLILSAVALLGERMPGVSTLDDLPALFGDQIPEGVEPEEDVSADKGGVGGGATFVSMGRVKTAIANRLAASVNVEDVRSAYYEEIEDSPEAYWWWIRAILIDPNEIIVDTNEGDKELLRVPYAVNGDEITFGESEKVKVEYVPAGSGTNAAAPHFEGVDGRPVTIYASRAGSRPEKEDDMNPEKIRQMLGLAASATAEQARQFLGLMASTATPEKVRQTLGLDADASDEDVKAKVDEINNALQGEGEPDPAPADSPEDAPAPEPTPTPAPATPPAGEPGESVEPDAPDGPEPQPTETPAGEPAPSPAAPQPAETPVTPSPEQTAPAAPAADGTVTVDAATWAQTQADARTGAAAATEYANERRLRLVDDAIEAGKFPPSRRDHWLDLLVKDPEGTEQTIASLAAGTIPLAERGESPSPEDASAAYPDSWFPEVAARKAAAASGKTDPFVIKE